MNSEEILRKLDFFVPSLRLSNVQEIVLRESCRGLTYKEIAKKSGYDEDYIRDVGFKLWQLLSEVFGEKVSKSNCLAALRRCFLDSSNVPKSIKKLRNIEDVEAKKVAGGDRTDWGEAIDVSHFFGRQSELATLQQWVLQDRCRVVGIFGLGGVGKTALSVRFAQTVQNQFDYLIWKRLRYAEPVAQLIADLSQFLADGNETSDLAPPLERDLSQLLKHLKSARCLIILDNFESVFQKSDRAGHYQPNCQGYGELISRIGETYHQSCLLLVSREKPGEISTLEGQRLPVRSLPLSGVDAEAGREILALKGLFSLDPNLQELIDSYAGNPLALKIVAATIEDLFNGNIQEFLAQEYRFFGNIRTLFDLQLNCISNLELNVLYWLALNGEPMTMSDLQNCLYPKVELSELLTTLSSLRTRSLIEKSVSGFTVNVGLMKYLVENIIEKIYQEIQSANLDIITHYQLFSSQKESIHKYQKQTILIPLFNKIFNKMKNKTELENMLQKLFVQLPKDFDTCAGYSIDNLLSLSHFLQLQQPLLEKISYMQENCSFYRLSGIGVISSE